MKLLKTALWSGLFTAAMTFVSVPQSAFAGGGATRMAYRPSLDP